MRALDLTYKNCFDLLYAALLGIEGEEVTYRLTSDRYNDSGIRKMVRAYLLENGILFSKTFNYIGALSYYSIAFYNEFDLRWLKAEPVETPCIQRMEELYAKVIRNLRNLSDKIFSILGSVNRVRFKTWTSLEIDEELSECVKGTHLVYLSFINKYYSIVKTLPPAEKYIWINRHDNYVVIPYEAMQARLMAGLFLRTDEAMKIQLRPNKRFEELLDYCIQALYVESTIDNKAIKGIVGMERFYYAGLWYMCNEYHKDPVKAASYFAIALCKCSKYNDSFIKEITDALDYVKATEEYKILTEPAYGSAKQCAELAEQYLVDSPILAMQLALASMSRGGDVLPLVTQLHSCDKPSLIHANPPLVEPYCLALKRQELELQESFRQHIETIKPLVLAEVEYRKNHLSFLC